MGGDGTSAPVLNSYKKSKIVIFLIVFLSGYIDNEGVGTELNAVPAPASTAEYLYRSVPQTLSRN